MINNALFFKEVTHMYNPLKNMCSLLILIFIAATHICRASDFVSITAPTNGSTISGIPLLVTGTSSRANAQVPRLNIRRREPHASLCLSRR